jgi:hypothetical protein
VTWIENWLQVSPDGGDGSLEMLLLLIAMAGATALLLGISRRARMLLQSLIPLRLPKAPTAHWP